MKKIKLLTPVLLSTVVGGSLLPLAGCGNKEGTKFVPCDSRIKYFMHADETDPYPVFNFKLEKTLEDGQYIKVEPVIKSGTKGVTCSVKSIEPRDEIVSVSMDMDGFKNVDEYVKFNLEVSCFDKNDKRVWKTTLKNFQLIAALPYGYMINKLYEQTISEFIEFSKRPHPSNPKDTHTLQDDTLNIIREYLRQKFDDLGYEMERDTYGNIWFDIPASDGYEKYPNLIIQGHMDMVVRGFDSLVEERTTGIDVVRTWKDGHEVLQSRGTAYPTSGFRKTSIGADDGICMAIVISLLSNEQIAHGPLRILFTSDEETGMHGAANLDPAVLNSKYLLNIDGEGSATHNYAISNYCYGFSDYEYSKNFTAVEKDVSLPNVLEIKTENYAGAHFYSDIHYKTDGAKLYANPDQFIFDVLNQLRAAGKRVQLAKYSHEKVDKDEKALAKNMAHNANVIIATDATESEVSNITTSILDEYKDKYALESTGGSFTPTQTVSVPNYTGSYISLDDSNKLTDIFGKKIRYEVSHWDGEDDEHPEVAMVEKDYPTQCCNFSYVSLEDGKFWATSRGNGATVAYNNELAERNEKAWTDVFGTDGFKKTVFHNPWNSSNNHKMLDLTEKVYREMGISPFYDRVRGGVEPAYFQTYRTDIECTCIGPWLEDIHETGETLYLETLPNIIKCAIGIIQSMWIFE